MEQDEGMCGGVRGMVVAEDLGERKGGRGRDWRRGNHKQNIREE